MPLIAATSSTDANVNLISVLVVLAIICLVVWLVLMLAGRWHRP